MFFADVVLNWAAVDQLRDVLSSIVIALLAFHCLILGRTTGADLVGVDQYGIRPRQILLA